MTIVLIVLALIVGVVIGAVVIGFGCFWAIQEAIARSLGW